MADRAHRALKTKEDIQDGFEMITRGVHSVAWLNEIADIYEGTPEEAYKNLEFQLRGFIDEIYDGDVDNFVGIIKLAEVCGAVAGKLGMSKNFMLGGENKGFTFRSTRNGISVSHDSLDMAETISYSDITDEKTGLEVGRQSQRKMRKEINAKS